MYSATRNDIKKLAAQIEILAKRVQDELDGTGDFLAPANELVRNSTTMVFALGEVYAIEQSGKRIRVNAKKVGKTSTPSFMRIYHRDSLGRFASK